MLSQVWQAVTVASRIEMKNLDADVSDNLNGLNSNGWLSSKKQKRII